MSEKLHRDSQLEKYNRRVLLMTAVVCTIGALDKLNEDNQSRRLRIGMVGLLSAAISASYYIKAFRSLK